MRQGKHRAVLHDVPTNGSRLGGRFATLAGMTVRDRGTPLTWRGRSASRLSLAGSFGRVDAFMEAFHKPTLAQT